MVNKIPLIIPVFNQLTYLKNTINWFRWYYPENPIIIVDNASNYEPLLEFYDSIPYITVLKFKENNCIENLKATIALEELFTNTEYYAISDPDLMPHPNTPPKFLEEFKRWIDAGYHRAGFGLITEDLPLWTHKREEIIFNEKSLLNVSLEKNQYGFNCYKAPIDTTFAMYSKNNSGWQCPMNGDDWGRCVRVFEMFHLPWYLNADSLNDEMKNYFATCKKFVAGEPSAGKNNHRPI